MNRRQFLTMASLAAGTALTPFAIASGRLGARFATPTFAAFLETLVPGPKNDPTGAPGAFEVGTHEYFDVMERSGMFPISLTLVQMLVTHALTALAVARHFRPFWALRQEQRERIVENLSGVMGLPFLMRLARAPFYVATMNRKGLEWIGLPQPPAGGYTSGYSWQTPLSSPEPGTESGNLP